jgi:hypothetical protein
MVGATGARNCESEFSRLAPARRFGFPKVLVSKERSMNAHERPIVTEDNKTAVRAGATGNNVRYVLIGSVALAIIAWILVEYFVRP